MATVSFFCTRCRRLTTFPASRRGAIVYCPRCQQALIVPDIPTSEDEQNGENRKDEEAREVRRENAVGADAPTGETGRSEVGSANGAKEEDGVNWAVSARRSGATVASHLTPGKERPENWRRVEAGGTAVGGGTNDDDDAASLLERKEVSDAEFLRRLRSEPRTQVVANPPVAPPVLWDAASERQESAGAGGIPKFVWAAVGVASLGSAFVVGAFWAGNAKNVEKGDLTSDNARVAKDGVFVEGALTYRTASGVNAPDDGAFVFLFPTAEDWKTPVALGDVSPQRPNSPGFENAVADLEARGARFAVADFEGRFAFDDLEPGEYRVLLVSRRVGDDWGNANPAALKEIERCVVSPRLLLGQSRFFWTTRRFDRDAATLEKSFGKAGSPFSNVE